MVTVQARGYIEGGTAFRVSRWAFVPSKVRLTNVSDRDEIFEAVTFDRGDPSTTAWIGEDQGGLSSSGPPMEDGMASWRRWCRPPPRRASSSWNTGMTGASAMSLNNDGIFALLNTLTCVPTVNSCDRIAPLGLVLPTAWTISSTAVAGSANDYHRGVPDGTHAGRQVGWLQRQCDYGWCMPETCMLLGSLGV